MEGNSLGGIGGQLLAAPDLRGDYLLGFLEQTVIKLI